MAQKAILRPRAHITNPQINHMKKTLKGNCFSILNEKGKQELLLTKDPSVNKLTFSIINNTGASLSFTGSTDGTGTSFNFNFESMLPAAVVRDMTLTLPDNWAARFAEGSETVPPAWYIYPTTDMVLEPGKTVKTLLTNFICTDTAPGNFTVDYDNIPGYDKRDFSIPIHLSVVNPPDPEKKMLTLQDGYTSVIHPIQGQYFRVEPEPDAIVFDAREAVPMYITYDAGALIENGFTYLLTNYSENPLVPASFKQVGAETALPPALYISFLFGGDDSDITTQQLGDNNLTIDISSALPWTPVKHVGGTAYWQFTPDSREVMKGRETLNFYIRKIITALNVTPDTTSIMYIQVNNVPGYNDALFTILLHKLVAKAKMESFEPSSRRIYIEENISVSWESSLAKRVTIDYYLKDGTRIFLDSAKGEIKLNGRDFWLPVPPTNENTVIAATAYDNIGSNSKEISLIVADRPQAKILFLNAERLWGAETAVAGYVRFKISWEIEWTKKLFIGYDYVNPYELKVTDTSTVIEVPSMHVPIDTTVTLYAHSFGTKYPDPTKKSVMVYT